MHRCAANTETLLFLSWITSRQDLLDEVTHDERQNHMTMPKLMRPFLNTALSPLMRDIAYGPVYHRLLAYRIHQINFGYVGKAIRGLNALYFKKEEPSQHQEDQSTAFSTRETTLLWEALEDDERLLARIKRLSHQWLHEPRRGARILRAYFTLHAPLALRTSACPFILRELLLISLERVAWIEVAAKLIGVPPVSLAPLKDESEEAEDPTVLFSMMQEIIWEAHLNIGEFSQEERFSEHIRELCLDLQDRCWQTHMEIRKLWNENGPVYTE